MQTQLIYKYIKAKAKFHINKIARHTSVSMSMNNKKEGTHQKEAVDADTIRSLHCSLLQSAKALACSLSFVKKSWRTSNNGQKFVEIKEACQSFVSSGIRIQILFNFFHSLLKPHLSPCKLPENVSMNKNNLHNICPTFNY